MAERVRKQRNSETERLGQDRDSERLVGRDTRERGRWRPRETGDTETQREGRQRSRKKKKTQNREIQGGVEAEPRNPLFILTGATVLCLHSLRQDPHPACFE